MLQRRLALAAAERDAAVAEVRAEMQAALHAKDEEFHRTLLVRTHARCARWLHVCMLLLVCRLVGGGRGAGQGQGRS